MATRNAPRPPAVPPEDLRAVPPLGMDPASIRNLSTSLRHIAARV
jgi:hypothetical protein